MYKRLIILSSVIALAIGGLALLGYHSITIWANGLEGARLAEFAEVAEQIRLDVKHKLDIFMQQEQNRPYTDYQYYSVSSSPGSQQQEALVISPLAGKIDNDLAFGNFQIEPDGSLVTPYYSPTQIDTEEDISNLAQTYIENIEHNLLPKLNLKTTTTEHTWRMITPELSEEVRADEQKLHVAEAPVKKIPTKETTARRVEYQIESLQKKGQQAKVIEQQRNIASSNTRYRLNTSASQIQTTESSLNGQDDKHIESENQQRQLGVEVAKAEPIRKPQISGKEYDVGTSDKITVANEGIYQASPQDKFGLDIEDSQQQVKFDSKTIMPENMPDDTVQIRIEPFAPLVVPGGKDDSMFDDQIFLLRHVQIEDEHLLQGFQLNERRLLDEIHDSAKRFIREGMDFYLDKNGNTDAIYSAVLDFGFGTVSLNLMEKDPQWAGKQLGKLQIWYFSIVTVVVISMLLVIFSLWRAMTTQAKLAEQKDDFISAVSHELRTPLTSIRMYAEMLENGWVKSQDKAHEYYKGMRQESERLSRLIENVLDFSRIQKGRKKYSFVHGDLNECVKAVIEVMRSYAAQAGFVIQFIPAEFESITFDADAVTQIVINLLDNAIKYAKDAQDKTIIIRTRKEKQFAVIEVEDHGPGIPHKQKDKVFDIFYRCEAEATRQTKGTGLGLALVSKFTQAHDGFVEILSAKPHGAIFRVGLAVHS